MCVCVCEDPERQLKDLAELKDQLESIQRRVENEVQAGIPQVSTHTHTHINTYTHLCQRKTFTYINSS